MVSTVVSHLLQIADIAAFVRCGRQRYNIFTEDITLPHNDKALFDLTSKLLFEYTCVALPECAVAEVGDTILISLDKVFLEKVESAEQAIHIHQFNSPRLATSIGSLLDSINSFPETKMKPTGRVILLRRSMVYLNISKNSLMFKYVEGIDRLAVSISNFNEVMTQQKETIDTFISQKKERVKRLQQIKEAYLLKKQQANPLHAILNDRTATPAAGPTPTQVDDRFYPGLQVKIIRTTEGLWFGIPQDSPCLENAKVSCIDILESVKIVSGQTHGLTKRGYKILLQNDHWPVVDPKGLYYSPIADVYTVIDENGKTFEFNHRVTAEVFMKSIGLDPTNTNLTT